MILDEAQQKGRPCNIIVTQPRRIAARSIASQVCRERRWELGTVVGYQVGICHVFSNQNLKSKGKKFPFTQC